MFAHNHRTSDPLNEPYCCTFSYLRYTQIRMHEVTILHPKDLASIPHESSQKMGATGDQTEVRQIDQAVTTNVSNRTALLYLAF